MSSILPAAIYKNKLYFLFGKERHSDDTPGWSDFGGGVDKNESYFEAAIREGGEEMTGFLGNSSEIKKMLTKHGMHVINCHLSPTNTYRVHIFPMEYNEYLPHYYNNNQKFLQKNLDPKVIKESKIFEKEEIRWVCASDLQKMKPQFRSFYRAVVDLIIEQKNPIFNFINKSLKKGSRKTRKNIKI